MRLGGPIFGQWNDPEEWIAAVRVAGYRAAYCPVDPTTDRSTIADYAAAASKAGIVIAEVGTWSNPLSPDAATRLAAIDKCKAGLALADEIGAACCVNIAGSRGSKWDGPYAGDLTGETFEMIVDTVREILDAVQPRRTSYTLETMPWMYPDSVDSYLALMKAIDRKGCAAHLDPVNLVCSPQRYFRSGDLLRECFQKLGPYIKSCHAKDIILRDNLTVHLDEVRPGLGGLDYRTFLHELDRLPAGTPLMLEHLPGEDDYRQAAQYVRHVADEEGIAL